MPNTGSHRLQLVFGYRLDVQVGRAAIRKRQRWARLVHVIGSFSAGTGQ